VRTVKQFCSDMWRENKPGFFILSVLLLAMIGSIGYYAYSTVGPGKFVVMVEKIGREEYLDIFTKATLNVYCREFTRKCTERGKDQVATNIRLELPRILKPVKTLDAKITYKNNTRYTITINRFLYRTAPGPWQVSNTQNRYVAKIERLGFTIEKAKGNVPFETRVDFANTLALVENHGSFTILPREEKFWRLGYTDMSEFQIEYIKNGKLYRTGVLRPR